MSPLDRASNQKQNTLAALFETPDPDFGAVTSTLEARDPSHVIRATQAFEQRKGAVLKYIRSVHTKNLTSVSEEDIRAGIAKYEEWITTQKGFKSNLADVLPKGKTGALLAGGLFYIVRDQNHLLDILAKETYRELFEKTEFFKNVSGVFATRLDTNGKTEVLLVRSKKTGIWQFPGGKAEYVARNPETGKKEIVAKEGDTWKFKDGTDAPKVEVTLENPQECLQREISEELGENVESPNLRSSGFYTIGTSRFLIHGFVANNLVVDPTKVKPDEIDKIVWTSNPFKETEDDEIAPIRFTDQTRDVLGRFFDKPETTSEGNE